MAQVPKRRRRWVTWCLLSILLALLGSWAAIDNNTRQAAKQRKLEAIEALKSRRYILPEPKESPFRLLAASNHQHSE